MLPTHDSLSTRMEFGLRWPMGVSNFNILLWLWKHYDEALDLGATNLPDRHELVIRAVKDCGVFTEDQVTVDPWFEEYAYIWSNNNFATVWGPASCGKSNSFGLFSTLWWAVDPTETMVFVCSTTREMLELRIWESVLRYFNIGRRKGFPGKLSRQRLAIINQEDEDTEAEDTDAYSSATVKACIKGVAVQQGTAEQARANLIGGHLPYVVMVIDEMQATREAAIQARFNLSKGCKDFRFFGLANPDSIYDLSGRHSEPLAGWSSVSVGSHSWKTRFGNCYHFDGFNSPACESKEAANKYPYLINREQIDRDIAENHGNEDAPGIWTYCRGWPPPQGLTQTVLSETEIISYGMKDPVVWRGDTWCVAGIDPAFSEGGDDAIMTVLRVGVDMNDKWVLNFEEEVNLIIKASSSLPVTEQLYEQVRAVCDRYGMSPQDICVDESGTQSFGDVIEMKWQMGVIRAIFQGKASDRAVSEFNKKEARKVYANKATEMWFNLAEFGKFRQIRNLPDAAARQFCLRHVLSRWPRRLEPKDKMRERIKQSPNEGDAAALAIEAAIVRHGLIPGASLSQPYGNRIPKQFSVRHSRDINNFKSSYLTDDLL